MFRDHVGDLLGGGACTFEHPVVRDRVVFSGQFEGVDPCCLPSCIPIIPELIVLYNKASRGKAHGENIVCTNALKHFGKFNLFIYFTSRCQNVC